MVIDSQAGTKPLGTDDQGLIDNEVPAYRALSKLSVLSLVLGISTILIFTDLWFSVLGVAAIVCGVLAVRRIRKLPDVLTGEKLANAGIGLGLTFVLCAWTISLTQGWIITHEAGKFAKEYDKALQTGSLDMLVFYQATPDGRREKTPQAIREERTAGEKAMREFEMGNTDLLRLVERLKANDQIKVEYQGIDGYVITGLQPSASAIFKITGPTSKEYPEASTLARVILQGTQTNNKYEWWVEKVVFPYVPKD